MRKLSFKKYFVTSIVILFISLSVFISASILNTFADAGVIYENDILLLSSGITSLENSNDITQQSIEKLEITLSNNTESDYIELVTNTAEANNLILSKLQSDGDIQTADMRITTMKFECIGDSTSISSFLNIINQQNAIIRNFCYRQNNDFLWLDRSLDNQAILDWLDFSNASLVSSEEEVVTIFIDDIKNQTDMRCYVEIEFISEW